MDDRETGLGYHYKVELHSCRANLPFWFASHCWLVTENRGVISRWEVLFRKNAAPHSWGHLHKDYLPPTPGIEIIPYWMPYAWEGHLVGVVQGDENSLAARMVKYIEQSSATYPYKDRYFFLGPNSNTYVQWVLNSFPEANLELPWNSYGKAYASRAR